VFGPRRCDGEIGVHVLGRHETGTHDNIRKFRISGGERQPRGETRKLDERLPRPQSGRQDFGEGLEARQNRILTSAYVYSDRAREFAIDERHADPRLRIVVVEGIVELLVGTRLQKANPPVGIVAQPKHRFAISRVACNPMLNPLQEFENMIGKGAQRAIDCRSH